MMYLEIIKTGNIGATEGSGMLVVQNRYVTACEAICQRVVGRS
jgi:hypothetical protein